MLVSDQPMVPQGVKTEASDRKVTDEFVWHRDWRRGVPANPAEWEERQGVAGVASGVKERSASERQVRPNYDLDTSASRLTRVCRTLS